MVGLPVWLWWSADRCLELWVFEEGVGDGVGDFDPVLCPHGPDQACSGEQERGAETSEQPGESETHLQGGVGDGADTELADQTVDRSGPCLLASWAFQRGCCRSKSVQ